MFVSYLAIFYKNKDNEGYTVVFPDLEYGATEGRNETEAVQMAQDYIGSWLYEDYLENNALPKSSSIEEITIEDDEFSDNDIELLDEVIKSFGNKTAKELVAYTHNEESLWNKTAKENKVLNLLENETINSTNLYLNLADLVANDPRKKAIYEDYIEQF